MNNDNENRALLDGYIGVKFEAIQSSQELPCETTDLYRVFKRTCDRLKAHNMTPANAGNLSIRYTDGLIISASGCNLGCIEQDELIFVEHCDAETKRVLYRGPIKPSSESIMHWLIYEDRQDAQAIIHAHDEFATRPELLSGQVEESKHEEPYGTIELARMAIETFQRAERIIVLKNHGYIVIGPDLDRTYDLIISTHLHLLEKSRNSAL